MKGTIIKCLQDLVTDKYGQEEWKAAIEDAGLRRNTIFMPISDIDDESVLAIITAVCTRQKLSLAEISNIFGDYWVNVYSQVMYKQFFQRHSTARQFILAMDDVHVNMTRTMANARPPRFDYEWKDDCTLHMTYKSHRGLIDLMVGLIKGVGRYYGESLGVTLVSRNIVQIVFQPENQEPKSAATESTKVEETTV
ncbi:MAG TPA: heme NO-binding domain-containing protein [candidate division Zixibacteria bacterium]|nr:heme NO-binding domain-containing protein [candidate division Zixibacteria bacterium]